MAGIAHQLCLRQSRVVVSAADGLTAAMKQVLMETNTQINGDIMNCHRNVTGLEVKLSTVKFQLLNAPVGFRAMEIYLHSSENGHG